MTYCTIHANTMPVSIVLHLGLASSIKPQRDVGRHIHGWFFHTLSDRYSKDFATLLHGSNAYTLSGLFPQSAKYPGDFYVRITSISEQVSEFLIKEFTSKAPSVLQFGAHTFDLEGIALDRHPMAKQISFHELSNNIGSDRDIGLKFVSPTSFHSNDIYIPLPIPFYVFNSLSGKWNDHAPQPLKIKNKKEFLDFVTENVSVAELRNVYSSDWSLPKGGWESTVGFEGAVTFKILKRSKIEKRIEKIEKRLLSQKDELEAKRQQLITEKRKKEKWVQQYNEYCALLICLSKFAFYCGVGHHTAEGMGQTREIGKQP